MLHSLVLFVAALASVPIAQASAIEQRGYGCQNNACLRAVVGKHSKPCKAKCESFLRITVTPAASTRTTTTTAYVTTDKDVPATAKSTTLVTVTQTLSVVETDLESVTATSTNFETATVTITDATTTVTTGVVDGNPPFKRNINTANPYVCLKPDYVDQEKRGAPLNAPAGPVTNRPTKIPHTASACTNSAAFSSACSCIGVTARTTIVARPTITRTVTQTITRAKPITSTVTTVTVTSIAKTDTFTTTYSTDTVTTTGATTEVDVTDATKTVTNTATVEVAPNPVETVRLVVIGSSDPTLAPSGGMGFPQLESFRGSGTVFYFDFTPDASSDLMVGINRLTGQVTTINGPAPAGESLSYSSSFGQASYVNVAPAGFAESQGGREVICKIAEGQGFEYLQCKWGDNQLADFWTCAQRLNFVQPGFDFSRVCSGASTSYKVPLIQVIRP